MKKVKRMTIKIEELNDLSDEVIDEIRKVESVCKKHDGLKGNASFDTSINFNKKMKSVFLLYEDEKLVSLLTVFAPRLLEGEVFGYTLPEYRRKGYFEKLLSRATAELKSYGVPDILFVCEKKSAAGNAMIEKLNVQPDHVEHLMAYHGAQNTISTDGRLSLHVVDQDDLEKLARLHMIIFSEYYKDLKALKLRLSKILESRDMEMYMAILGNEAVGVCTVSVESDGTFIEGFGILPKYRGKGFGREFLNLILKNLLDKKVETIKLEVDDTNHNAFELYKKAGFEVETSFGYYRKRI